MAAAVRSTLTTEDTAAIEGQRTTGVDTQVVGIMEDITITVGMEEVCI
jgi:hypothetical protein